MSQHFSEIFAVLENFWVQLAALLACLLASVSLLNNVLSLAERYNKFRDKSAIPEPAEIEERSQGLIQSMDVSGLRDIRNRTADSREQRFDEMIGKADNVLRVANDLIAENRNAIRYLKFSWESRLHFLKEYKIFTRAIFVQTNCLIASIVFLIFDFYWIVNAILIFSIFYGWLVKRRLGRIESDLSEINVGSKN